MSHPVRKWLKELANYGRQNLASPTKGRSPIVWLADLPRLGQMWLGHIWFRIWLDLWTMPSRVYHKPGEHLSPFVWSYRPTHFNPPPPVRYVGSLFTRAGRWITEDGPERLIASLAKPFAGGLRQGLSILFFGAVGAIGVALVAAGKVAQRTTHNARNSLAAAGNFTEWAARGVAGLFGATGKRSLALVNQFTGNLRSPQEVAWTIATMTGTVGLILLLVLHLFELPVTANRVAAADSHTVRRPPQEIAQAPPEDDPFGGLPSPFGPAADLQSEPPGEPDLAINVDRTELPYGIARFNLPDDDEQFIVSSSAGTVVAGVAAFPPDDWLRAIRRNEVDRPQIIPAAYRESKEHPLLDVTPRQPSDFVDSTVPAGRDLAISIRKTLPAGANAGELLWYDLIVSNDSGEEIEGVVIEERVDQPHRIADAQPAAAFEDGVLTWRFERLRPYEERRLSVAVYPMADAPIQTSAVARALSTVSATTLVEAEAEQPARQPDPFERSEPRPDPVAPRPELVRRIMIEMTTPERAASKANFPIQFVVTNTGSAPLTDVAIDTVLPEGLIHPDGASVTKQVGDLAPGESRKVEIYASAGAPGEPAVIAQVAAAEGVATTVQGSFRIVESLASNNAPDCCQPMIMVPVR